MRAITFDGSERVARVHDERGMLGDHLPVAGRVVRGNQYAVIGPQQRGG